MHDKWKRLFAYLLLVLAAGSVFVVPRQKEAAAAEGVPFPGWPSSWDGVPLVADALTEQESVFGDRFPGRVARFHAGEATVVLRWATEATHRVHSASACLRASGWSISPLPMVRRSDGAWSCFRATRDGVTCRVREQARAADGETFPDVPTWFGKAFLGRSPGPWWIVTVSEPE